jgi:hypothetical protein
LNKKISVEGQTRVGMPRGAKISSAFTGPKKVALHSNSNNASKHAGQVERTSHYCMQNNQWKSPNDFKNNSNSEPEQQIHNQGDTISHSC